MDTVKGGDQLSTKMNSHCTLVEIDLGRTGEIQARLDGHCLAARVKGGLACRLGSRRRLAKQGDSIDFHIRAETKLALDLETAFAVRELQLEGGALLDGVAVVKVQTARGSPIKSWGDDELEALLAQLGGGHGGLGADGDDAAAADVDGDFGHVDVAERDVGSAAAQRGARVPVVEDVVGEVCVDRSLAAVGHGTDQDGVAVEELQLVAKGVLVLGIEVEHGLQEGLAGLGLPVEGCVDVVKQPVADVNGLARGLGNGGPAVELLRDAGDFIVVAEEGVEGSETGPASAELLGGVAAESAHV